MEKIQFFKIESGFITVWRAKKHTGAGMLVDDSIPVGVSGWSIPVWAFGPVIVRVNPREWKGGYFICDIVSIHNLPTGCDIEFAFTSADSITGGQGEIDTFSSKRPDRITAEVCALEAFPARTHDQALLYCVGAHENVTDYAGRYNDVRLRSLHDALIGQRRSRREDAEAKIMSYLDVAQQRARADPQFTASSIYPLLDDARDEELPPKAVHEVITALGARMSDVFVHVGCREYPSPPI